jgi:LacI family transcriptional regulator
MMGQPRATQKDIALAEGISQAAVSMALRGDPRITTEVRKRVLATAERLGYFPDPMLGALADYRRERKGPRSLATVAYVYPSFSEGSYLRSPFAREAWEGARIAGESMGYRCEPFIAGSLSPQRLQSVWRHRGIRGVIIGPVGKVASLEPLESEDFAIVQIGRGWGKSGYNRVTPNHFENFRIVWRALRARGYRRIAFLYRRGDDDLTDSRWRAAYRHLAETEGDGFFAEQEVFQDQPLTFSNQRPDAVIGTDIWLRSVLQRRRGWQAPDDVGFASLAVDERTSQVAGVSQGPLKLGEMALRLLDQGLRAHSFGVPEQPAILAIRGRWHEGQTVRAVG